MLYQIDLQRLRRGKLTLYAYKTCIDLAVYLRSVHHDMILMIVFMGLFLFFIFFYLHLRSRTLMDEVY